MNINMKINCNVTIRGKLFSIIYQIPYTSRLHKEMKFSIKEEIIFLTSVIWQIFDDIGIILAEFAKISSPWLIRSSHQRCSIKKSVLRIFAILSEKHLRQSLSQ